MTSIVGWVDMLVLLAAGLGPNLFPLIGAALLSAPALLLLGF